MMQAQSTEFLLGYLFNDIERKIIKDITGKQQPYTHMPPNTFAAQIPLLWFGAKNPNYIHPSTRITLTAVANELCLELDKKLRDIFPKRIFHTIARMDGRYFVFLTTMVEDRRKLTVSQIEDLLGYKVTIVSEEDK